MDQRVSLITLGVADVGRSRAFYEASAGTAASPDGDVVFFQAGGMIVALWDRAKLAEDSGVSDAGGSSGLHARPQRPLARGGRTRSPARSVTRAATITREPAETFWGGYSLAFTDPDGHPWEIAHNPCWTITDDGRTLMEPE